MTPQEKAGQTMRERKQRERENRACIANDRKQTLAICRQIRDNPKAADADRLTAIQIIHDYTEGKY